MTEEDGSCENISCYGCIDANACNYSNDHISCENCVAINVNLHLVQEKLMVGTILENDSDGDGVCNCGRL